MDKEVNESFQGYQILMFHATDQVGKRIRKY